MAKREIRRVQFQHHCGKLDGTCCWCLIVGIGNQVWNGKRESYSKGDCKTKEEPGLGLRAMFIPYQSEY
ncbi:MAG: hypothetical protein Ct9H90mP9_2490 [Pseudomonadota bacterium]|nr:MAG: hypothetical protein Ct9H90mP9_2490 [Pseudomonadota bacterium]